MNHRQALARLQEVIADIDAGRLPVVPPPPSFSRRVGSSVLVAALGLSASACDRAASTGATTAEPSARPTVNPPVDEYAVEVPPPTAESSATAYGVEPPPEPAYAGPDRIPGPAPDADRADAGHAQAHPRDAGRRVPLPRPMYMASERDGL